MKRVLTIVLAACAVSSFAQEVIVNRGVGLNADSPYNRLYNSRTVVTFKGTISGIQAAPPMNGTGNILTFVVKADNGGTTIVDVGPEWFVSNQRTAIRMKDRVQVTGSKVLVNGRGVIIAQMIVKNRDVLTLRAPDGRPYWDAVYTQAPAPFSNDRTDYTVINGQVLSFGTFEDGTAGTMRSLVIRTDDGDYTVGLAPDWYLRRQDVQIALGDNIRLQVYSTTPQQPVGSGLVAPPIVYASSINRGGDWLILRFVNGRPVWLPVNGG